MNTNILVKLFIGFLLLVLLCSCTDNTQQAQSSIVQEHNNQDKFNTEDKAIFINGNIDVAIKKINQMGIHSIGVTAEQSTAEIIS
nr:hypothetical protein [Smithellaceae bacterium]